MRSSSSTDAASRDLGGSYRRASRFGWGPGARMKTKMEEHEECNDICAAGDMI